jgi:hypothetical protein
MRVMRDACVGDGRGARAREAPLWAARGGEIRARARAARRSFAFARITHAMRAFERGMDVNVYATRVRLCIRVCWARGVLKARARARTRRGWSSETRDEPLTNRRTRASLTHLFLFYRLRP